MKIFNILEARRSPATNRRDTVAEFIDRSIEKNGGTENLFLSFQNLLKTGVNPKSVWDTPAGFYSYPAAYLVKRLSYGRSGENRATGKTSFPKSVVPYGTNMKFLYSFSAKGNLILVSSDEGMNQLKELVLNSIPEDEVLQVYNHTAIEPAETLGGAFEVLGSIEEISKFLIDMVYLTVKAAILDRFGVSRLQSARSVNGYPSRVTKWFLDRGVDGLVDMGKGIIYNVEPSQAVIFNPEVVEIIDVFYNDSASATGNFKKAHQNQTSIKKLATIHSSNEKEGSLYMSPSSHFTLVVLNPAKLAKNVEHFSIDRFLRIVKASIKHLMYSEGIKTQELENSIELIDAFRKDIPQLKTELLSSKGVDIYELADTDLCNNLFELCDRQRMFVTDTLRDISIKRTSVGFDDALKGQVYRYLGRLGEQLDDRPAQE